MTILLLGLVVFLGAHAVRIVAPSARDALAARLGAMPFRALYSLVSLVGLVLIVVGYGAAREAPVPLWDPPVFTRHLAATLMIFVFPLLFAAYLPGRISRATKHPMLAAVKIWAFAHLIANGTLADVVLFGSFLAWAVAARISAKRHPRPAVVTAPPRAANDAIAVIAGLVVYALFVTVLHLWLIGVAPLG
ncbi:NnrU family protein [Oharaeibacter diazotrophicus]|uniref:Putative membrane protein n=1 Tax=Oharaeibacter diazotrophicus TaxID=1920512 RepID=A0A4R6RLD8_9HYPH|nr:NnrU family protein [Oharaeibacter diazotrophicus]TDP86777.1 putative membrane protein [Oharaeibacter diazotrophicus]BBE71280.1 NnrU protein [Pleomorphomonas sp. SM30]GLS78035.1 hypothetical protein GCM10007904_33720 [Oharaeibacter diazotrophicus]